VRTDDVWNKAQIFKGRVAPLHDLAAVFAELHIRWAMRRAHDWCVAMGVAGAAAAVALGRHR
jgi:hypothetical protein